MLYAISILVVLVVLFALCKTQEKALDAERDARIKIRQVLDQLEHPQQ